MTWKEVLKSDYDFVIVQSYGYEERNFIDSHFEPFKNLRKFKFGIDREYNMLIHNWLFLDEPESELNFEEKDGKLYVFDPDLWARME